MSFDDKLRTSGNNVVWLKVQSMGYTTSSSGLYVASCLQCLITFLAWLISIKNHPL